MVWPAWEGVGRVSQAQARRGLVGRARSVVVWFGRAGFGTAGGVRLGPSRQGIARPGMVRLAAIFYV